MTTSTQPSRRGFLRDAGLTAAALSLPMLGHTQTGDYPSRPIKLNVGFSAGGLTDVLARLAATSVGEKIGQPVVIENRTGAAGNIATEYIAKAPADGYNLLFSSVGQIVVSPHTFGDMRVNPLSDLTHISMIGEGDLIVTVNTQVPAQTIQEFIALVKKSPGKLFFADSGAGGNLHLYMEYFNLLAGIKITPPVRDFVARLRDDHRLLTIGAGDNVLRLIPPLIVTEDDIEDAILRIAAAFDAIAAETASVPAVD